MANQDFNNQKKNVDSSGNDFDRNRTEQPLGGGTQNGMDRGSTQGRDRTSQGSDQDIRGSNAGLNKNIDSSNVVNTDASEGDNQDVEENNKQRRTG